MGRGWGGLGAMNAKAQKTPPADTETVTEIAPKRLKSLVERIERLEQEKADLMTDIKDVYAEAKAVGFDPKTLRKLVRLRKMDEQKRREEDELLELYKAAIGLE